jgi:excisionase family DNA binding protein
MQVIADKFYTVAEACEILGLTRQRVCQLIKGGQLDAEKAHDMLYIIPAKSLAAFQKIDRPNGQHIANRQNGRKR